MAVPPVPVPVRVPVPVLKPMSAHVPVPVSVPAAIDHQSATFAGIWHLASFSLRHRLRLSSVATYRYTPIMSIIPD